MGICEICGTKKEGVSWTYDTPSLSYDDRELELCVLWCTWEWNHITDVLHTGYEEDAKIQEVVDFLNKNPEAKVVVTGYADKGTGNDVINDRIAAKRAAAVVWMLEKRYGIPAERIIEESKGSRVQPFAENNMNRVSIMIAK